MDGEIGSPLEILERIKKKRQMLKEKPSINININLGLGGNEREDTVKPVIPYPSA